MKRKVKKMSSLLIYVLLIAIWNSILFYGKEFGVSVLLFIVPLLTFIYFVLKQNNKIKNKYGLLFMIPIILLSTTYLVFNNSFFRFLNMPIIVILFTLIYIYTIKPTFNISVLATEAITILVEPLTKFSQIYNLSIFNITKSTKINGKTKSTIKSILIILPIVLFIIVLLSSADAIFANLFSFIFEFLSKFSIPEAIKIILTRSIPIIILFFYIGGTLNLLIYNYENIAIISSTSKMKIEANTIKILLTILNIIYIIFDIIQIKSLILHQISMDITYAEYAREGFFQLMFVSVINLAIILISKFFEYKYEEKDNKYINIMSLIMTGLTFVIIISSFLRMNMYENEYGYTLLRLLVYITLITESILLIPTIKYILDTKFNIVKYYLIIIISVYTLINFINVDYLIANRNIKRYYETEKIDIDYLMNNNTDNVRLLIDLYHHTNDPYLKDSLLSYFSYLDTEIDGFQEFNISKYIASKKVESLAYLTYS